MKKIITIAVVAMITFTNCVQEEFEKTITFKVDTNGIEDLESLGIRGDFLPNRWNESVPLTDANNDGIYELTLTEKTAYYNISFKFVKNGFDYELKEQDNREIVFEYKPENITYITKFNNPEATIKR